MKLEIKNLRAEVDGKEIIRSLSLTINSGEVHALMGPNGSGKSTLSYTIMGHPKYKITGGDILVDSKSVLKLATSERAKLGIFLGFQYPQEIAGVGISNFLRTALAGQREKVPSVPDFHKLLKEKMQQLGMPEEFLKRGLNQGFSGGEKKRSEILQLSILTPKFAILDEPDSGTDVDGLKAVAQGIRETVAKNNSGVLLITHYNKILEYIKPDFVHVVAGGKIVKSGGPELAVAVESHGYAEVAA